MLVEVVAVTVAVVVGGVATLRVLFGPGEEEAKERMDFPFLSGEIAVEKVYKREIEYIYRRGGRIYTQTWYPSETPKGIILLVHGMSGHSGRFGPFYDTFLKAGYVATGLDLRGFGRSSGRHGYVSSIADLADDVAHVLQRLKERFPNKPLFLLGGSMGGLTAVFATLTLQKQPEPLVAGVILHAPALHISSDSRPSWIVEQIGRLLFLLAPKLPLLSFDEPPNGADGKPLAIDDDNDPLYYSGLMRIGTGLAIVGAVETVTPELSQVAVPFLIQHGDADKVVPPESSKHLTEVAKSSDKTLLLYPKGGHLLWAEPDFIKDPFMADMVSWMDARLRDVKVDCYM
ncbi:unnamed protein product [Aphanomyces euteiches]|uniref:Serine aminopeptidase S33 domain-containing protein n=1 Tax=Aphanomyces euteiches TaxID=100861 RepID=A0A6G0WAE1_9STRA|nr:hypothetical protein Ae201684_017339 [Aphanomyces euteiches]KAH9088638.1 hypothetical protein Ae201684P_017247 [Aphanomyces euteiches]KAH9153586.1 hypothetical protein AeRB84_004188 [Aphanomyces euteiches]